jgi:phosphoribosylanthranilate isomerase
MPVVKICGLTNLDDARAALEAGADYLGFVLYQGSPRAVRPARLAVLVERLPAGVRAVGVFVNATCETVRKIVADCRLYAVQLHGSESPEAFARMGVALWRAVRREADEWAPQPARWTAAECLVVDAAPAGVYGGAGQVADWTAAAELARTHRTVLAGGLTPANVAEAVQRVQPWGVDVASGVESSPGRKDHDRVAQFVRAAKAG